jgi:hypothetical protein
MSAGFGGAGNDRTGKDARITINLDNVAKLTKKYKKLNKYMKSTYYDLLVMSGTEKIITNLVKEEEED